MHHLETPPLVERVVDGDDYAVAVRINPLDALPQILAALGETPRGRLLTRLCASPRIDPRLRAEYMRELAASYQVRESFVFHVAPSHAEDVGLALDDAATEPERCLAFDCTDYQLDRSGYCPHHLPVNVRSLR